MRSYNHITSHHGVSIRPGSQACAQAKKLGDTRFLSRHAPALPLEGCDSAECACRYRHYEDRRQQSRRSINATFLDRIYSGEERRTLPERRRIKNARGQSYFEYCAGD